MQTHHVDTYRVITPDIELMVDWLDFQDMVRRFKTIHELDPNYQSYKRRYELADDVLRALPKYKYITFKDCMTYIIGRYSLQYAIKDPLRIE